MTDILKKFGLLDVVCFAIAAIVIKGSFKSKGKSRNQTFYNASQNA